MSRHFWKSKVLLGCISLCSLLIWPTAVSGQDADIGFQSPWGGKQKPLQIKGLVMASTGHVAGEISLKENGAPLSGARVMLGRAVLVEKSPGFYSGGGTHATALNTVVRLLVWRKPGTAIPLASTADYTGTSSVRNWLKPIFPEQGQSVAIPLEGKFEMRWSFAVSTEKSCLFLRGVGTSFFYSHCQTELKHSLSTSLMQKNAQIRWEIQNFFADFAFNRPLAPDSQVGFCQTNEVKFYTL